MPEKQKSSWFKKYGFTLILCLLILSVTGGVGAKYVYENGGLGWFKAKEFYFTSNYLKPKSENASYVINSNATSISFTLGNNIDDLRFTEDTIAYTVSVEDDDALEDAWILSDTSGELEGNKISMDTIALGGLKKGVSYTVTAFGEAGYESTLKAVFTVAGDQENVYYHLDSSDQNFILLTVWSEKVTGDLIVDYPAGLIPDATDSILRASKNYNKDSAEYTNGSFTDSDNFDVNYSSRVYRFFVSKGHSNIEYTSESFKDKVNLKKDDKTHLASASTPK